jgi:hypothetical protein
MEAPRRLLLNIHWNLEDQSEEQSPSVTLTSCTQRFGHTPALMSLPASSRLLPLAWIQQAGCNPIWLNHAVALLISYFENTISRAAELYFT